MVCRVPPAMMGTGSTLVYMEVHQEDLLTLAYIEDGNVVINDKLGLVVMIDESFGSEWKCIQKHCR